MDFVSNFKSWCKKNEGVYALKRQIINDKLKAGVGGVEWLVLNLEPKAHKFDVLNWWIEDEFEKGNEEFEGVMIDSLTMESEQYYFKHQSNWWMAVDLTLHYLYWLKRNHYNNYFEFINNLENKLKIGENQ